MWERKNEKQKKMRSEAALFSFSRKGEQRINSVPLYGFRCSFFFSLFFFFWCLYLTLFSAHFAFIYFLYFYSTNGCKKYKHECKKCSNNRNPLFYLSFHVYRTTDINIYILMNTARHIFSWAYQLSLVVLFMIHLINFLFFSSVCILDIAHQLYFVQDTYCCDWYFYR